MLFLHIAFFIAYSIGERYIDDLVQHCSNPCALAVELLQCCTKPSILCIYELNEAASVTFILKCPINKRSELLGTKYSRHVLP